MTDGGLPVDSVTEAPLTPADIVEVTEDDSDRLLALAQEDEEARAELNALTATIERRDERERSGGKSLREATRALAELLRDLPGAETYLLLPHAVDAWRVIRDEDPDAFLIYMGVVRQKCGNTTALLLQQRVGPPGAGSVGAGAIPTYPAADVWAEYSWPLYLVKRLLSPDAVTVLFGQSGHLKSVSAIDLALSVGTGTDCQGLSTRKAGVLYVCGEGHAGIKKRIRGWMIAHGMDATSEPPLVYVTSEGADLLGNPGRLRATVEAAAAALGVPIELVVIDTLAANFGAGDENHAADMQRAIAAARSAAPGAAVLIVHHTGHSQTERERGSYALIAAADFRVQATYDDGAKLLELKWLKCKDDEAPQPMTFECRQIALGWTDEDGEELTSVVLERLEGASLPHNAPRIVGLGKHQEAAMKVLRTLYARARRNLEADGRDPADALILTDGWRNELVPKKIPRQRFHDAVRDLQERRLIVVDGPHVRLIEGAL